MSTFNPNGDTSTSEYLADEELEDKIEDNLEDDDEEDSLPSRFSISVSRRDFDVEGIVRRLKNEDIEIPDFQRNYVWKPKQASRLIESLLLGLPVPGIFMSIEPETKKMLVLDGQQRLISLRSFYDGKFPNSRTAFCLKGVHQKFERETYKSLKDADRRQLDNSVLSATIVEPRHNNEDSIYYIFERLNTGGTLLKPQEIRACIYHGEINELIHKLNKNDYWRELFGKDVDKNKKDQELILRFLALYFDGNNYKPPLKEFLNKYMKGNRHLKLQSEEQISKAFIETIEVVHQGISNKAFHPQKVFSPTLFEAVMVGIARRLEQGAIKNFDELREWYNYLLNEEKFVAVSAKIRDLTSEHNIKERLRLGTEAFADLE